ncbi:hypothetical protein KIPB_002161 [Kipferlia bialata]|uniref:Uncharacterized protein n=1 Tax=Kipferlia bialata TaxID=797122 RepID=A0A9K3CS98_9EUKA|nr:hypothetical protein KIPB_002161 [Kipferlia bialata]|eukprot:g2161.t1
MFPSQMGSTESQREAERARERADQPSTVSLLDLDPSIHMADFTPRRRGHQRSKSNVRRLLEEESLFNEREGAFVSDAELSDMVDRIRPYHSGRSVKSRSGSRSNSVSPVPYNVRGSHSHSVSPVHQSPGLYEDSASDEPSLIQGVVVPSPLKQAHADSTLLDEESSGSQSGQDGITSPCVSQPMTLD